MSSRGKMLVSLANLANKDKRDGFQDDSNEVSSSTKYYALRRAKRQKRYYPEESNISDETVKAFSTDSEEEYIQPESVSSNTDSYKSWMENYTPGYIEVDQDVLLKTTSETVSTLASNDNSICLDCDITN